MKKGVAIENITITIHGRTRGEIKATQFWRGSIDMQLEINHPTKIVWRNESIRLPIPTATWNHTGHAWGIPCDGWSVGVGVGGVGVVGPCKVKLSTVQDPNFPLSTSAFNVETTSFAALVSLANIVKSTTTLPGLQAGNKDGNPSGTRENATLQLQLPSHKGIYARRRVLSLGCIRVMSRREENDCSCFER